MTGKDINYLWQLPANLKQVEKELELGKVRRCSDSAFKFIFCCGERSPIFLDLISSIVYPGGNKSFKSVEFIDREFSPDRIGGKGGRLDALAIVNDGGAVNLEVQVSPNKDFLKRVVMYASKIHSEQLNKGKKYFEAKRTISINILGYNQFPKEKNFRNSFSLRNDVSGVRLNDDLRLIFLEIPKFTRSIEMPRTKMEKWLAYLAGMGGKEMEELLEQEPKISEALIAEKYFSMDTKTRLAYIQEWKRIIEDETREALAEARGREEGRQEGVQTVMEALKKMGVNVSVEEVLKNIELPVDQAARGTGFSLEGVSKLADEKIVSLTNEKNSSDPNLEGANVPAAAESLSDLVSAAKAIMGQKAIILDANKSMKYDGKIVIMNQSYAIQEIAKGMGKTHRLKQIDNPAALRVGERVSISYGKDGRGSVKTLTREAERDSDLSR